MVSIKEEARRRIKERLDGYLEDCDAMLARAELWESLPRVESLFYRDFLQCLREAALKTLQRLSRNEAISEDDWQMVMPMSAEWRPFYNYAIGLARAPNDVAEGGTKRDRSKYQ